MTLNLVTGANGHVGNNLCRLLVTRGEKVRAMIRASADPKPLDNLSVEIVRGDVLDARSADAAVQGCSHVYHAAAGFLMWAKDPERDIVRPSVEGTRNVLEAAAKHRVEKVVYVSTGGTIGFPSSPGERYDETHYNTAPHTYYLKGKLAAERTALDLHQRGLAVTMVNPGLILGPRFYKLSESVRQIADFVNHGAPVYFDGGFGVVDVEDVARGAILAMEKGRAGERYILSGDDVTVKQTFDICAELTGVKSPTLRVPVGILRIMAGTMELVSKLTGSRPLIDRSQVDEFAGKYGYLDSSKAQRELGYEWRSARDTLRRTIAWLVDQGFVTEKRRAALRLHPELQGAY
jgi:dihydroflavonol-4-reductase